MKWFNKVWNFEFEKFNPIYLTIVLAIVVFAGLGYVIVEVLLLGHPGGISIGIKERLTDLSGRDWLKPYFSKWWLALAVFCATFRFSVIVSAYLMSKKKYDKNFFNLNFLTNFTTFITAFLFNIIFLFILGKVLIIVGVQLEKGVNIFERGVIWYENFITTNIPTIVDVKSYPLAIVLTVFVAGLPGYFSHWLSHTSRFFWLVFHRSHHYPVYLNPIAAPPAYAFEFIMVLTHAMIAVLVSKLIYTEPLIMEMSLWYLIGYCMEIFNHSIVHYEFAYNNIIVRNLCRLFGDRGVYHLVHHSAFKQDQNINFSGSPFNFWDRVFGTYRKPYKEPPPIGLTDNPPIYMNPFRIIFGGCVQLIYELKNNSNIKTRFKILFGNVYYMPPITKDYLKK